MHKSTKISQPPNFKFDCIENEPRFSGPISFLDQHLATYKYP